LAAIKRIRQLYFHSSNIMALFCQQAALGHIQCACLLTAGNELGSRVCYEKECIGLLSKEVNCAFMHKMS
jgi:hypothetical protein